MKQVKSRSKLLRPGLQKPWRVKVYISGSEKETKAYHFKTKEDRENWIKQNCQE